MYVDSNDELGDEHDPSELSAFNVEVSDCFGTVTWVVAKVLYDLLPRRQRDELLTMTGDRKISPYFVGTCERLLRQAGCSVDTDRLSSSWSFQTVDVTCSFGQVTWQVGEGLWDELPEDQRDNLIEAAKELIHVYFHGEIQQPLLGFGFNKLYG